MAEHYLLLTTWPDLEAARSQAASWLQNKLAANVNILPEMDSIYRWKGEIRQGREFQVMIKTSAAKVDALEREIKRVHPYPVAEILRIGIESGNPEYLDWISRSTR